MAPDTSLEAIGRTVESEPLGRRFAYGFGLRVLTSILIGDSNCALAVPVDAVHEIGGALKRFHGAVSNSVGNFLYDCSFGSSFRYLSIS